MRIVLVNLFIKGIWSFGRSPREVKTCVYIFKEWLFIQHPWSLNVLFFDCSNSNLTNILRLNFIQHTKNHALNNQTCFLVQRFIATIWESRLQSIATSCAQPYQPQVRILMMIAPPPSRSGQITRNIKQNNKPSIPKIIRPAPGGQLGHPFSGIVTGLPLWI